MPRRLVLLAASGLAREVAAIADLLDGYEVLGCLDDDQTLWGARVGHLRVLGGIDQIGSMTEDIEVVACAGEGATRRAIVQRLAYLGLTADRYATVIHPSVHLPHSCRVASGSVVMAHTALTADVTIGHHVVVMPNCTLTHDDVVEDYATFAAGVSLAGGVRAREASYVGMNASVRQHLVLGSESTIGMGAAVTRDVPPGQTWIGAPARPISETPRQMSPRAGHKR